jgi:predicted helicase
MNSGYIYIRVHDSYEKYNVCKLGKTLNLMERNSTYKTSEVECGFFELVIKVKKKKLDIIERLLQNHFKLLQYYYYLDGGTEFFKKDIIPLIIPYLKTLNLQFTILSKEQIKLITWKNNNIKEIVNKININNLKNILKFSSKNKETNEIIIPREHQINVLLKIDEFYKNNNIGKLIHGCGLGKALLGILIVQKLNCKLVVIGVPSVCLQKQMKNEIMKIYNNHENILYIGGETEQIISTTKENDINKFINKKSSDCKFLITIYNSCDKLLNYTFDFKIGDEAHHLVGSDNEKTKDAFHNIKSNKTLFMTATAKVVNNKSNKVIYSMDDETIFGKVIDEKSINWAIENKKITDYNLVIIKNTENEINNIINSLNIYDCNKDLFLSAFMSLKSIEKYTDLTHILIYTNKKENCELVKKYIDDILELNIININKENYYNEALHSDSKKNLNDIKLPDSEISKFKKASWGIISSVYIFGEGFDCPKLNGVVFGENMESDIRIVQSTLRPNRLDSNFPDKKAYVIIPYIEKENWDSDNESFEKCRKIIAKIGNYDERIEQKIRVVSLNKSNNNSTNPTKKEIKDYRIIENSNELTKIKLRLKYRRALDSLYSEEQDEYNYVISLNKELNIQSKEQYVKIKDKHKNYIDDPEGYFKEKGIWSDWYDFIGIDTKKFIQDKNDWYQFCKENNVNSLDDYNELCKLHEKLPMNPCDFYIGFVTIPIELGFYSKRRK